MSEPYISETYLSRPYIAGIKNVKAVFFQKVYNLKFENSTFTERIIPGRIYTDRISPKSKKYKPHLHETYIYI